MGDNFTNNRERGSQSFRFSHRYVIAREHDCKVGIVSPPVVLFSTYRQE